jgi:SulP family sulfate permease
MVKHAPRHDILVLLITFGLTIFTDLVVAINVGVLLAVLLFVQRMSQSVHIDLEDTTTLYPELYANGLPSLPKDVLVYSIQGPFFFGAAETLEHTLAMSHMDPRVVVFRLKHVPFMDMTGLQTFYDLIEQFHRRGVLVYLCEVRPTVSQKLIKVHILQWVQGHQFYKNLADVIKNIC